MYSRFVAPQGWTLSGIVGLHINACIKHIHARGALLKMTSDKPSVGQAHGSRVTEQCNPLSRGWPSLLTCLAAVISRRGPSLGHITVHMYILGFYRIGGLRSRGFH